MYYGDWSVWAGQGNFYPQDIPADQLTNLNFAFMDFDSNGNLVFTDADASTANGLGQQGVTWGATNAGILPALINLKAQNPNLKVGVSLGGWSKSGDFSAVAANPTARQNLIDQTVKFITYTDMDFVDIDWEYPTEVRQPDTVDNKNDEGTPNSKPEDYQNYITLLQGFRDALDAQGEQLGKHFELSVALPGSPAKLEADIDTDKLFSIVDFANMMNYDLRGAWDAYSGHHTALYGNPDDPYYSSGLSVDQVAQYLLGKGVPSEKIVIGAAFYTRGWEKVDAGPNPDTPGLFGAAEQVGKDADQTPTYGAGNEAPLTVGDGGRRSGLWSYRGLDALKAAYPGLQEYWDDVAQAPSMYNPSTGAFFTYDNEQSIAAKAKYVNDNDLGGMIAWMASEDAPSTAGSAVRDTLTKAMNHGLNGDAPLPANDLVSDPLDITASAEAVPGTQGYYQVTFTNNESASESNAVLAAAERIHETVFLPKLYIKTTANITGGDNYAGVVSRDGDYVVVDTSGVYDARTIGQGASYSFQLKTNSETASVDDIESITLVQHVNQGGAEFGSQVIFDQSGIDHAPTFAGVDAVGVVTGDAFDPMAGVSATDRESGDLTSAITVTGTVDTSTAGTYTLEYSVSDGVNTATATRVVTVSDSGEVVTPQPDVPEWDAGTIYTAGQTVTYQGKTYLCQWWTLGNVPTDGGPWLLQSDGSEPTDPGTDPTDPGDPGDPGENGPAEYVPGNIYVGGDKVTYQGQVWVANWWTTGVPGEDQAWTLA
jgi:chitinase